MKKTSAKKGKKQQKRFSGPDNRRAPAGPIDEAVAQGQRDTVSEIVSGGKTAASALEVALSAIIRADHLMARFEAENPLPKPLACHSGCDCCCYNQIEVTPPEALLLGDYVAKNFSQEDRQALTARLERLAGIKAGKTKTEIARLRQGLPCPFLAVGKCTVYPVRPLVCRAMHALDAGQCEAALASPYLLAVEHYSHRRIFTMSVVKGLLDGCRALGCQAGSLDLAGALQDFCAQPHPLERWIQGEQVFSRLSSLTWK